VVWPPRRYLSRRPPTTSSPANARSALPSRHNRGCAGRSRCRARICRTARRSALFLKDAKLTTTIWNKPTAFRAPSLDPRFSLPVVVSPGATPGGGRHGQAYPRVVAAYLHGRVRRRRHVCRNPAPLKAAVARHRRAGVGFSIAWWRTVADRSNALSSRAAKSPPMIIAASPLCA